MRTLELHARLDELREIVRAHPALLILLEGRITKLEAALKEEQRLDDEQNTWEEEF